MLYYLSIKVIYSYAQSFICINFWLKQGGRRTALTNNAMIKILSYFPIAALVVFLWIVILFLSYLI